MLLAMSSILINQQYMLNKLSLNRSTHTTRLCIDSLSEMFWPELRNLTLYFSLEATVQYTLIHCSWKPYIANNKKWLLPKVLKKEGKKGVQGWTVAGAMRLGWPGETLLDKRRLSWDLKDKKEGTRRREFWVTDTSGREMAGHVVRVEGKEECGLKSRSEKWMKINPCSVLQSFNLRTKGHDQISILRSLWLKCGGHLWEQNECEEPKRRLLLTSYRKWCAFSPECWWLRWREAIIHDITWEANRTGLGENRIWKSDQEFTLISETFPWQYIPVSGDSLMIKLCPSEKYRTSNLFSRYWTSSRAGTPPSTNLLM